MRYLVNRMVIMALFASVFGGQLAPYAVAATGQATAESLATVTVQSSSTSEMTGYDGVVEAVRQTSVAAQVAGAITALYVKPGDKVVNGQLLARIDARTAAQGAVASQAQAQSARAALDLATRDVERQRHLYAQHYISQAALERAETQFRATSIKAPYAGVIAEVPLAEGDMATPGKVILTMYDPSALRVTAHVPQAALASDDSDIRLELPGLPKEQQWLLHRQIHIMPTADASTHTAQVRIALVDEAPLSQSPVAGIHATTHSDTHSGITPGMFARVWLPGRNIGIARLYVPVSAIVRREEMTGVYVVQQGQQGQQVLVRQVRLGRVQQQMIEIVAGLSAGERVAVDAQSAIRRLK